MLVVLPDWEMLPFPEVTWPPVGAAWASCAMAKASVPISNFRLAVRLPRPLATSETGTHVLSA